MNSRRAPARRLAAPGALLLTVSFALFGCSKGTEATQEEGPITSRLNALYGGGTDIDQRNADVARYDEVVAACMQEEGFEYTHVPIDKEAFAAELSSADSWDVMADAKENGYGITPASKNDLIEQYGLGQVSDADVAPDPSSADPNIAYFNSLSAGDQAAYEEAMYGAPEDQVAGYDWTATGCVGKGYHEVYEAQEEVKATLLDSTVIADFHDYVHDRVTNDPRIDEAEAAWASCMADKGFAFADREEASTSIQEQFDDLTGIDPSSGSEPDLDRFTDAELTALHDDEIATATADAQCYMSSDIDSIHAEVELDAETEFYNTHKTEVDAWIAAQEAAQKKD